MRLAMVGIKDNFLHVPSSVRTHQHVSHWTGYSEPLYCRHTKIFREF